MATILMYERYNVAQINEPVHANEELVLLHNELCRGDVTRHEPAYTKILTGHHVRHHIILCCHITHPSHQSSTVSGTGGCVFATTRYFVFFVF